MDVGGGLPHLAGAEDSVELQRADLSQLVDTTHDGGHELFIAAALLSERPASIGDSRLDMLRLALANLGDPQHLPQVQ